MPTVVAFALPELWVAIALLLLLWAIIFIFQKPIAAVLGLIPAIGGQLADAFSRGIGVVVSWAANWAATAVKPLVELISAPVLWLVAVLSGIVLTAEALESAIADTATMAAQAFDLVINRLFALISQVATIAGQVANLVTHVAHVAAQLAWVIATGLPGAIDKAVTDAIRAARALVAAVVDPLARALDALRAWAQSQVAHLDLGIQAVRDWATGAIAAAVAVAVRPIALGLDGLGHALDGLRVEVNGKIGTILGLLAPLLALDLVRVVPRVIEDVTTMRRECVDPTCSVIGPQVATLQSLLNGVEVGLFLAFLAEAVHDPAGTARAVAGEAAALESFAGDLAGAAGLHI